MTYEQTQKPLNEKKQILLLINTLLTTNIFLSLPNKGGNTVILNLHGLISIQPSRSILMEQE